MVTLSLKAFRYVIPVKASVTVIDKAFHKMGDVNWDGVIDSTDLELLKAAFGSTPGAPNWNPDCDLNEDGKVDITDIVIAARNFGAKAPQYATPARVEVEAGKVVLIASYAGQTIKKEITASSTVIFIFTVLGLLNRAVVISPTI